MAKVGGTGGLVSDIKDQIKKSGNSKSKLVYFKEGIKVRLRFLQDMEDGMKLLFHDSFKDGINTPCLEIFGKDCPYCGNDSLRHRDQYAWSVYDYDAKETKLLVGPANQFSPIPAFVSMFEAYGTITDRDYVVTKTGSQTNSSFGVVPMDKARFRNENAKPFSEKKALELIRKAFPTDGDSDDSGDSNDDGDYSGKTAKELYDVCKERGLEVEPRKDKDYYIDTLEADDKASSSSNNDDDWGDDWGDEPGPDYSSLTPKELYNLCKEKGINAEPKKDKDYYISILAGEPNKDDDGWD